MSEASQAVDQVLLAEMLIDEYFAACDRLQVALKHDDDDRVELVIAEANRIYPAIWDALDHARNVFAGEQRDVDGYDRLRQATRRQTWLGIEDVERSEWEIDVPRSILSMGISFKREISVQLNMGGVALARQAATLLQAAAPDVDWDRARRDALAGSTPGLFSSFQLTRGVGALLLGAIGAVVGMAVAFTLAGPIERDHERCRRLGIAAGRLADVAAYCASSRGRMNGACFEGALRAADRVPDWRTETGEYGEPLPDATEELASAIAGLDAGGSRAEAEARASELVARMERAHRACVADARETP